MGHAKITGLLRLDQVDSPSVGELVIGQDGNTYRVTDMEEFGGLGRFIYTLEVVDDDE